MRFLGPYRLPNFFYALLFLEFPVTVACLALFGIASPDLYRTRLWQDGADNGFNSSPSEILYSYANYRPIAVPKVWAGFITSFNVVIAVLSTFIMLVKIVMYILHVFPPILSLLVHGVLLALYAVSVDYQTAKDLSDKLHPQNGPPWYITKSCSVAADRSNVGYCEQAKSAFACTVIMVCIFAFHVILALVSIVWAPKRSEDNDDSPMSPDESALKSPEFRLPPTPGTTGGIKSPTTPRTLAFNKLGGTKDLPLRNHFSSPTPQSPTYNNYGGESSSQEPMYFPPPPKAPIK